MRKRVIRRRTMRRRQGNGVPSLKSRSLSQASKASTSKLIKSPYHEDGTITLWHGSPAFNKDSILQKGIIPRNTDAERQINNAIHKIAIDLNVNEKKLKRYLVRQGYVKSAKRRLLESKEKGGVVYLSGNKEYAKQNALAGLEWYYYLLLGAKGYKYRDFYKAKIKLARQKLKIEDKINKLNMEEHRALSEGNIKKYRLLRERERKLWQKMLQLDREFKAKWEKTIKEINSIDKRHLPRKIALFKVKMPVSEFKRLADDYTKKEIENYENQWRKYVADDYKVVQLAGEKIPINYFASLETLDRYKRRGKFAYFQEVRLKSVPPKYIKKVEITEKPRFFL